MKVETDAVAEAKMTAMKDDARKGEENGDARPKIESFDDILPYIGEASRYQLILFLVLLPFTFVYAFLYFAQFFITLVPENHWCHVPELESSNFSDYERWDQKCFQFSSFFLTSKRCWNLFKLSWVIIKNVDALKKNVIFLFENRYCSALFYCINLPKIRANSFGNSRGKFEQIPRNEKETGFF